MLVRWAPADSAMARAVHGEYGQWTVTHELLAAAVDVLQLANWQRGGGKGSRPKKVPRPRPPGAKDPNVTRIGSGAVDRATMDALLGWG